MATRPIAREGVGKLFIRGEGVPVDMKSTEESGRLMGR